MGDRGNIVVVQRDYEKKETGRIYLYTHWSGSEIQEVVQTVLKRQARWNDGPYLTRMLFCELVKGQEGDETGFGISNKLCDNEHDLVVVDPDNQKVWLERHDWPNDTFTAINEQWTFAQYIKRSLA